MQHRQRKLYLDGMKGLASISVMLGHYIGIYKYAGERAAIQCGFMKFCTTFPFSAFMREEFWLYLFFVVSGYLVSASRVEGVVSALRKSAGRIVRFAIPITGAAAIVVLLGKTLGFHNQELRQLIENKWFFLSYREPVKWIDALLEVYKTLVQGKPYLIPPFWVMRDMLFSSLIIYAVQLLRSWLKRWTRRGTWIMILLPLTWVFFRENWTVFACLCGATGYFIQPWTDRLFKRSTVLRWVPTAILPVAYFLDVETIKSVVFTVWVLSASENVVLKRIYSSKIPIWLGKVSLGVFSLHWSIYCSVGMLLFLKLYGNVSNSVVFAAVFGASISITLAAALAFRETVEKLTAIACAACERKPNG